MKTFAATLLFASARAFAPATLPMAFSRAASTTAVKAEPVPLAGGMSFNRVCREWRCKYTGDKTDSESLAKIACVVDEYLPAIKEISDGVTVNRLVCGSCLDFKLMITVPLEDLGAWEGKSFAPEEEFIAKLKDIDGVSQVETQTITNMIL